MELLGRSDEAAAAYYALVQMDDNHAGAWHNLGCILGRQERFEDAAICYRAATDADPNLVVSFNNLGGVLYHQHRLDEAMRAYGRVLELGETASVHHNIGMIYQDQGRLADAIASYRKAMEIDPGFKEAHSALLFCLCFDETSDPDQVFQEHLDYGRRHVAANKTPFAEHANARDPNRRLKVGYVSPDFRLHPCSHFVLPVLEHHDKSRFEIFCYFNRAVDDPYTELFRRVADHWSRCQEESDEALAARIRDDGIDILVECAGHMGNSRLPMFGLRPAPIQVSHPLYPNTTGVATMDYRIMDPIFAPPWADAWHSESLVRMPQVHVSYRPHRSDVAPSPEPPFRSNGYVTFGCFNNFAKIGESTVDAWSAILRRIPTAKLMLKWKGLGDREAERYARARFVQRGVDPDRIVLVGWSPDPYTPYHAIDIALDPFFANGGTTTCDALWMGVPIVTCHGRTPFSRVGLCHLTNIGLPDLITADAPAYIDKVAWLACDIDALSDLRRGMRERFMASPLMDGSGYTRHLEDAYRVMWRRWCAGLPPAPIDFPLGE
ncbi:hypothetical protein A6A04_12100 [Paramagnetospirillum marisnigri]|uniref:protein O-GlcNAc transferase n=1 Tax=Paramagnetospirillum marisnigri TaxID=1285242 RepID=A0A178MY31_9PROT|nr:hypothetical protein A6A04_12100 [Paramagnetospirillum marisnigri]